MAGAGTCGIFPLGKPHILDVSLARAPRRAAPVPWEWGHWLPVVGGDPAAEGEAFIVGER